MPGGRQFRSALWMAWLIASAGGIALAADEIRLSSKVEKPEEMRTYYGVGSELLEKAKVEGVRVAVMSAGFSGIENQAKDPDDFFRKQYLPNSMQLIDSYDVATFGLEARNEIGRRVAQTAWAMTGLDGGGPEFRLYNSNGLAAFRQAVEAILEWKADVILCTENFSAFGNFDGTGILNRIVDSAAFGETIWIQSAGEFATKVLNLPIALKAGKLDQPDPQIKVNADDTEVTVTLSWNAYSPGLRRFYGTDKDLDLVLEDKNGREVAKSRTRQVEGDTREGETNFAVEQLSAKLFRDRSPYVVRLLVENGDFDARSDELRLTLETDRRPFFDGKKEILPVELVDATRKKSMPVPADNRMATTVGSTHPFSSQGPTADGRQKPDVVMDSAEVRFTDKVAISGPDVAVAQLGAVAILYKANEAQFTRKHWLLSLEKSVKVPKGDLKPDRKKSAFFEALDRNQVRDLVADN